MSALTPKADIGLTHRRVRLMLVAVIVRARNALPRPAPGFRRQYDRPAARHWQQRTAAQTVATRAPAAPPRSRLRRPHSSDAVASDKVREQPEERLAPLSRGWSNDARGTRSPKSGPPAIG